MVVSAANAAVNVNGQLFDREHAVISVFDHGFLYGEGVYETLRTYNGRPFLFDRHMHRLRTSARMIALPIPLTDAEFSTRCADTQRAAGLTGGEDREAYIRILVTRGIGALSYDPAVTPHPSVVVIVKPHVQLPESVYRSGVSAAIVSIVRNHPETVNPRIKSNNLLNCALAAQEAVRRDAFEGIMRNHRGELAECSTSNLFIVKNGQVLTPPLEAGLLPGLTRGLLFEIGAARGISVREATLLDADLFGADEAFLTSTTREIVPIVRVDDRPIASGAPGPVALALLEAFREQVHSGPRAANQL
ncbi:MAG: branched-chain amino acid aminotransferase [Acidimicrobiia bacterium]|nr:branched-chain amino acid aminotransferase [Acidimicrobiia bacterium]